jgi:arsenate reductase-like glutaredoxin family protein
MINETLTHEELQALCDRLREDWAREFEKRGTECARLERRIATLSTALMRLRDEADQLCPTQVRHIALEALR